MVTVLPSERRDLLLAAVRRHGSARIADLADEVGVSGMTVRRDIDALAQEGTLLKVRGGVTLATARGPGSARPPQHPAGDDPARREKEAVARLAAQLVEPGMSVGVSAGSTAWYVARELLATPEVTVVTNSLTVADLFADRTGRADLPSQAVVLTGGVRTPSAALVGPVAVRSLSHLHCDIVFLSVHGIDPQAGLTTPNILEAETDRALLACGQRTVVVADHGKWGRVSLTMVADLDAVDTLVVGEGLGPDALGELRGYVADVRLAEHLPPAPGGRGEPGDGSAVPAGGAATGAGSA